MKKILNVYTKVVMFLGIIMFLFLCTGVKTYAQLPDVKILGGSYGEIREQAYDTNRFQVHHLISKEAWNRLGDQIVAIYGITPYNEFIANDLAQNWAPSILMAKEDHEKTRSFSRKDRKKEFNSRAYAHIDYETERLLNYGAVIQLLNEECDDIRSKFGDKYDKAIAQMFLSIRGQFQHKGNDLLIYDLETGYYVRYRFGDALNSVRFNTSKPCGFVQNTFESSASSTSIALAPNIPFTFESLAPNIPFTVGSPVLSEASNSTESTSDTDILVLSDSSQSNMGTPFGVDRSVPSTPLKPKTDVIVVPSVKQMHLTYGGNPTTNKPVVNAPDAKPKPSVIVVSPVKRINPAVIVNPTMNKPVVNAPDAKPKPSVIVVSPVKRINPAVTVNPTMNKPVVNAPDAKSKPSVIVASPAKRMRSGVESDSILSEMSK